MQNNLIKRCLAKTRRRTLCQTACVKGKKRCRMHGGAKGSGAPKGSKNAFKHGRYSAETIQRRVEVTRLIRQFKEMEKGLEL